MLAPRIDEGKSIQEIDSISDCSPTEASSECRESPVISRPGAAHPACAWMPPPRSNSRRRL